MQAGQTSLGPPGFFFGFLPFVSFMHFCGDLLWETRRNDALAEFYRRNESRNVLILRFLRTDPRSGP